jgi:hypothetical protein
MDSYSTPSVWIARRFLKKIWGRNLPPKSRMFWGVRDPERRACSLRGLGADWTGRQGNSKAADSKVDLDTDADLADRTQGEESPRFQYPKTRLQFPPVGILMLVSHRKARQ